VPESFPGRRDAPRCWQSRGVSGRRGFATAAGIPAWFPDRPFTWRWSPTPETGLRLGTRPDQRGGRRPMRLAAGGPATSGNRPIATAVGCPRSLALLAVAATRAACRCAAVRLPPDGPHACPRCRIQCWHDHASPRPLTRGRRRPHCAASTDPPASLLKSTNPDMHPSGVRSQESGVRSQESGVRGQEPGVRSQEPGASGQGTRGLRTTSPFPWFGRCLPCPLAYNNGWSRKFSNLLATGERPCSSSSRPKTD
jgi:hypothetical protein